MHGHSPYYSLSKHPLTPDGTPRLASLYIINTLAGLCIHIELIVPFSASAANPTRLHQSTAPPPSHLALQKSTAHKRTWQNLPTTHHRGRNHILKGTSRFLIPPPASHVLYNPPHLLSDVPCKKQANTASSFFLRTPNTSPITPKSAQQNPSKTREQAKAEGQARAHAQAHAEEARHSPLTAWAYQTENSHLTIHEKLEKDRWECGSGNGARRGEARL
jgi:hypothetical protein